VQRIALVEDHARMARLIAQGLEAAGMPVDIFASASACTTALRLQQYAAIVLDRGLPDGDGLQWLRQQRGRGCNLPCLMLTARDKVEDRVRGLEQGADDYLVKPFERQELLARMRALLRRRPPRGMAPLRVGDLSLNPDTHEVHRGERRIELTQREFELLEYLMRNERLVISRQKLLDEVWGYDPFSITNTIEVFVSNLRRKLEAGGEPRLLHTVRGAGYVLRV